LSDPGQLVHSILQDLYSSRRLKSRVILRMLPVCGSCKAFAEDMLKFLHSFLQPWFLSPNHASYQICFKSRNNNQSKRDDVIKSIAGLVNRLNPKNKVDLTDPELSIIIEVIKSVCCVSVIRDYKRFRKYNLQEVAKGPANQESPQQEVTEGLANQESPQQEVTEGLANQESPQQEVTEGLSNQESPQQEVTKDPANQESPQQEVTEGLANQESPQQKVTEGLSNQESPQQEVGKNEVKEGEQEVLKDLASQEQGQQEVMETKEQNVGGANGIKQSEKE
ncbi:THUMP domain-containing protein 1, partial [Silurus asotus]